jgi:predicted DNA-binding transcriptional regulator AlpA
MTSTIQGASKLLTTQEASDYLRIAASTLNKMRLTGGGPEFLKLGPRRVVYDIKDLERWLGARRRKSTSHHGSLSAIQSGSEEN